LSIIANKLPEITSWGWGDEIGRNLGDPEWLEKRHPPKRGKMLLESELHWLLSGWWACARHNDVVKIQTEEWFKKYVSRAVRIAERLDWMNELETENGGKILVALARASNSGKSDKHIKDFIADDGAFKALERFYLSKDGYDKEKRWQRIITWSNFEGPAPSEIDKLSNDLNFLVQPKRTDGSTIEIP